jgi:hypothetical protein
MRNILVLLNVELVESDASLGEFFGEFVYLGRDGFALGAPGCCGEISFLDGGMGG